MLAPNVFGSLSHAYDYWGPGYETMTEADWTDRAVNYLFFGTLPALLIFWHGIAGGRLLRREMRFTMLVLGTAALYAVGRYTPIFGLIFDLIPGVSLYRRPADATFILNVGFALASGYLLHRYIEAGLPRPRLHLPPIPARILIGTAIGVPALLIGLGLAFSERGGHVYALLQAIGCACLIAAAGAALLCYGDFRRKRGLAAALLVAATAGELVWRNAASSLNAEPASLYSVYARMTATESAGLAALRDDMARAGSGEFPRVEILGLNGAWQNASMVLKLQNTLGYNPLRISDYERAVGPGENAGDPNLRHFPGTFRGYRCRLASLLGLEYVVLDRPLVRLPRQFPKPQATQIFAGDHFYVYRFGRVAPRAYFATHAKPIDNEATIESHELPDFDRTREALVDQDAVGQLTPNLLGTDASAPANSKATIAAYSNNSVRLEVSADRNGLLILHDLYYPGWEATVDGVRVPSSKRTFSSAASKCRQARTSLNSSSGRSQRAISSPPRPGSCTAPRSNLCPVGTLPAHFASPRCSAPAAQWRSRCCRRHRPSRCRCPTRWHRARPAPAVPTAPSRQRPPSRARVWSISAPSSPRRHAAGARRHPLARLRRARRGGRRP